MSPVSKSSTSPAPKRADGIQKKPVAQKAEPIASRNRSDTRDAKTSVSVPLPSLITKKQSDRPSGQSLPVPSSPNHSTSSEPKSVAQDMTSAFPSPPPLPVLKKPTSAQPLPKKISPAQEQLLGTSQYTLALRRRRSSLWLKIGIGIGSASAALLVLSTIFARVTLTVHPLTQDHQIRETRVILDANISQLDTAKSAVPAEFLEFQGSSSQEFTATGKTEKSLKSRGRARIYNNFSASDQRIVATTRFLTPSGALFRLVEAVIIPGAKMENGKLVPQFIEVELVADKPGTEYNMTGEIMLKIPGFQGTPKYEGFYAKAMNGFSGGVSGPSPVASADDIRKAQEKATKRVFDELKEDITKKIPPHLTVAEGLREIQIVRIDAPRENEAGERFTIRAHARARVAVFREEDMRVFLEAILFSNDTSHAFIPKSGDLRYRLVTLDPAAKRAEAFISGSIRAKRVFSESDVKQAIQGQKEKELPVLLQSRNEFDSFKVEFFPPWLFRVPHNPHKITVITVEPEVLK